MPDLKLQIKTSAKLRGKKTTNVISLTVERMGVSHEKKLQVSKSPYAISCLNYDHSRLSLNSMIKDNKRGFVTLISL